MKMYRLVGKLPVEEPDLMTASMAFGENRTVKFTKFEEVNVIVSTVFLGLDMDFSLSRSPGSSKRQPLVFETMVQGGLQNGRLQRYRDFDEAILGHHQACREVAVAEAEHLLNPGKPQDCAAIKDLEP